MSTAASSFAPATITEEIAGLDIPIRVHPDWAARWDWLVQGTTWRGPDGGFDLGLFGSQPVGAVLGRWRSLVGSVGGQAIVHARQVHGAIIRSHRSTGSGIVILNGADGHHTRCAGLMLTVSVADCVPVFIVDPDARTVTLLHAGWRGIAAGIVETGIRLAGEASGDTADLHVHFGPAICGSCYEVGPEVHERLGLPVPPENRPVDLRAAGAARALAAGVPATAITVSDLCTRCAPERPFFSHRAGESGRQVGLLGIRPS